MQPTLSPVWAAWSSWLPREAAEGRRMRVLRPPPRDWTPLAVYTPDQIRHLIRLESALSKWPPTSSSGAWRRARLHNTYELDARWRLPELLQNVRLERTGLSSVIEGSGRGEARVRSAGEAGAAGAAPGWAGAGWAAGALLLAALLLLVRVLERCLHRKLFKGRSSSNEWPTPNVQATSYGADQTNRRLDESGGFSAENSDMPPPYSECSEISATDSNKPLAIEEPPPPYSSCCLENQKDGLPTVHFQSRRRKCVDVETGQSSTNSVEVTNLCQRAGIISNSVTSVNDEEIGNVNQRQTIVSNDRLSNNLDTNVSNIDFVSRSGESDNVVHTVESETARGVTV